MLGRFVQHMFFTDENMHDLNVFEENFCLLMPQKQHHIICVVLSMMHQMVRHLVIATKDIPS
jgi:hypothetical protein